MRSNKRFQLALLVFTLISLLLLVGIQVTWIMRSARMQETQFNHAVTLAMDRIVETISNNEVICQEVSNCLLEENAHACAMMLRNRLVFAGIDTLIRNELQYYNIDLDFEFDIVDQGTLMTCPSTRQIVAGDNLEQALADSGYELRIRFPDKTDFIKAQMGYVFISSIALLLLVHVSFLLIYRFYKREKKLTGNIIDFVNNITHELKTPLTNIALANSMLSKNRAVESDQKLSSYTRVIRGEHQRLKDRVDILLKASLLESNKPMLSERFDAVEEVSGIAESFSLQAEEKGGVLKVEASGDAFDLAGDVDMFRIAISNLVDNAIKYNHNRPEIMIQLASDNDKLKITIADNGVGIPKEFIPQIFDKYFRVPTGDIHDNDGFGLGLFLVKNILKKMNGRISVSSRTGMGTVFTIKLPLACK